MRNYGTGLGAYKKMRTPICDFVKEYSQNKDGRFHMPGHKGNGFLGVEALDITEIKGADSLFEAEGIIKESEENASRLFDTLLTLYSCEGSSLSIRAMLYIAARFARLRGRQESIIAGRNAHKTFVNCAALLDITVTWIGGAENYLKCTPSPSEIEKMLIRLKTEGNLPAAIYLTSPDYLGNMCDIEGISKVCREFDVLLLVDNAHGAYLHFLDKPVHPIDLGADFTSDSAHKTLPVLTGGAYLQVSKHAAKMFGMEAVKLRDFAKEAMSLFASTSPSYLIMQSLDYANYLLDTTYSSQIRTCTQQVSFLKKELLDAGYTLWGDEPMKITIYASKLSVSGNAIAEYLRSFDMECEFADPDFIVFMFTPNNARASFDRLKEVLLQFYKEVKNVGRTNSKLFERIEERLDCPLLQPPKTYTQVMPMKESVMSSSELISASQSEGRVLALPTVSCPPAVPIVMCGELITEEAVKAFEYYGIEFVSVVKIN